MGILNIGTNALLANMVALQTVGNNIANVNTPGYSGQTVLMQAAPSQYTGNGYIGEGVGVQTIKRNYDAFLTRQANVATAAQASDTTRSNYLKQLTTLFQGGANGLGQSINSMLNAFSDVASTPTDMTARTVALTQVSQTASQITAASQSLDDLQSGISQSETDQVKAINTLATQIAGVNAQIIAAQGSSQPPNALLDQRDQLISQLNGYVKTTSVTATDGSIGVFIGGSQPLVLGSQAAIVSLGKNAFSDPNQAALSIQQNANSPPVFLDQNALGGGSLAGTLQFQNTDLVEGRNLLGRLTAGVTTSMNTQQSLGLDLNGNPGQNLFSSVNVNTVLPSTLNTDSATVQVSIANNTQFVPSDYLVKFDNTGATVTRVSDGTTVAGPAATLPVSFDGLTLNVPASSATPGAGDSFYLKPFSTAASNVTAQFSTPTALAMASPVVGSMGVSNLGSLQLTSLAANVNPPANLPVTISFSSPTSYTRSDTGATIYTYTAGQPIQSGDAPNSWTLNLQGTPMANDSFSVQSIKDPTLKLNLTLNGGNATAMVNLGNQLTFDGGAMSDGYASMIGQIGVLAQSATYSAQVSANIATTAQANVTSVSGVNLDEEASKLMQYQQAYQASAKMIQVAQTIFNSLMTSMG